jgi:hypothetical protein
MEGDDDWANLNNLGLPGLFRDDDDGVAMS